MTHHADHPDPPSDGTTLTEIIDFYERAGYVGVFGVTVDSMVECATCESMLDPRTVVMHSLRRLEGASDPDDMVAVAAVTCPVCSADGTLTMMFGPAASSEESDVFGVLRDHRSDAVLPAGAAPGESVEGS